MCRRVTGSHRQLRGPERDAVTSWFGVVPGRVIAAMVLAFIPMLIETWMSWRHEGRLRNGGAIEPTGDPYRAMAAAYPIGFGLMGIEGSWWARPLEASAVAGLVVWVLGKAIKYWAMATLGERWSFRVLVTPGAPLLSGGPYRFVRHPNYLGVMGELAGMALLCPAPYAGTIAVATFGALLRKRIAVEERALGLR
jgi:methyltransferase